MFQVVRSEHYAISDLLVFLHGFTFRDMNVCKSPWHIHDIRYVLLTIRAMK